RSAKSEWPEIDLIITHFVNEAILRKAQDGKLATSVGAHEQVAEHYNVSTCNVAVELASQIASQTMDWKTYGGVHPAEPGNRLAASLVEDVFEQQDYRASNQQWNRSKRAAVLPEPLRPNCFDQGRFLPQSEMKLGEAWRFDVPDWKRIKGGKRSRFNGQPILHCRVSEGSDSNKQVGSDGSDRELSAKFQGNAVGLYVLAGPDAAVIEYSLDGNDWKQKDLFHRFSERLHYPRTVVLESGLSKGVHQLRLRLMKPSGKRGNSEAAARILHVVYNGNPVAAESR
ncbi:MAG: hypothetical protein AAFV88_18855, partial [Planctomycetota bacterium]